MFVLKNLSLLQQRPTRFRGRIFEKLFEEAEIAKLNPTDMKTYQESLKVYRDNYNTLEFAKKKARLEGKLEGRLEGKLEGKTETTIELAREFKRNGASIEMIMKATGLSREQVESL